MQIKKNEKDFFDQWTKSKEYDVLTSCAYDSLIREFRKIIGNNLSGASRLIDLGCGTGTFARKFFVEEKAVFFGLDISPNSVKVASRNIEGKIRYLAGDIENLCIKDETFDVIVFSGVLHHFANIKKSLSEGYRILKKGGYMLSYDPNMKNPFMWLYRHQSSPFYSRLGKTENERLLSDREVIDVMKITGFNYAEAHCIGGVTFRYVQSPIGRLLLPFYNMIEFLFGKLSLARKYGSFLICYGKKE